MDTTFQDLEKRFKKLEIIAELAARIPYQDEKEGGMLVGAIEFKAMLKALVEAGIVPQVRKLEVSPSQRALLARFNGDNRISRSALADRGDP